MSNQVVHFELWSQDPVKIGEFYAKALGWKVTAIPAMNYRTADTGSPAVIQAERKSLLERDVRQAAGEFTRAVVRAAVGIAVTAALWA